MSIDHQRRAGLIRTLGLGRDCIPIERLGELSAADRGHVDGCARCQTEEALWQIFDNAVPMPGEGASVRWAAAELRRRAAAQALPAPPGAWRWVKARQLLPAAAAMAIAAAAGYVARDPEPGIRTVRTDPQVYRTARLNGLAPLGDRDAAPRVLEWVGVSGAAMYDVEVFEVDRSILWRGSSSAARVVLPLSVSLQFVPGKPVLWEVKARSASGVVVADSGTLQFRVSTQSK